ncbi:MAG: pyridoxamine 5'-phosphate oxidase family protein, partial [Sphingobacteriales bacterium]|nr:pyridoxamine 5'-phosphate oxidase family protein [Sphingobacteriales bacterium]
MPAVRKTISHELKDAEKIIARSQVCFLAMSDQDIPYVVPMNFGYHEGYLYLHTGPGGKKLDILARNPEVSIAFSLDEKLH